MSKLNVLLLGWEFVPAMHEKQETSCYHIAKALAKWVDLSVLLPKTDSNFILSNLELTGLNQVDLEDINPARPNLRPLPYADETYIKTNIPLYGLAVPVSYSAEHSGQEQSRRTVAATFTNDKPDKGFEKEIKQPNIFAYKDFDELRLDAQVIEYARYTSRWASQRNFDIIYAYNYMTFLAGTELKLVSGKKLVLHVHSLSYERHNPNSKGWMYELEKQALQKGDYIITNTSDMATIIEKEYGISLNLIKSLEEVKDSANYENNTLAEVLPDNISTGNSITIVNDRAETEKIAKEREQESWQQAADTIWEVIQKVVL